MEVVVEACCSEPRRQFFVITKVVSRWLDLQKHFGLAWNRPLDVFIKVNLDFEAAIYDIHDVNKKSVLAVEQDCKL